MKQAALALLGSLLYVGLAQSHGGFGRFRGGGRYCNKGLTREQESSIWTSTGMVPDKVAKVPDVPLEAWFGRTKIYTNQTYDVDQLLNPPTFIKWAGADPASLYTLILEDQDIKTRPVKYAHLLITNMKGNNLATGDSTAAYIPPFDVPLNDDGTMDKRPPQNGGGQHRYVMLVFKQKGVIGIPEGTSSCNPNIVFSRIYDHAKLQEEFDLEGPVAGTFLRTGYSRSGWSEFFACKFTRCVGQPFPGGVIPGVNDKPECQRAEE